MEKINMNARDDYADEEVGPVTFNFGELGVISLALLNLETAVSQGIIPDPGESGWSVFDSALNKLSEATHSFIESRPDLKAEYEEYVATDPDGLIARLNESLEVSVENVLDEINPF